MNRVSKKKRSPKLKEYDVPVVVELAVTVRGRDPNDAAMIAENLVCDRIYGLEGVRVGAVDAYEGDVVEN